MRRLLIGYDVRRKPRDYVDIVASITAKHGRDALITDRPRPLL